MEEYPKVASEEFNALVTKSLKKPVIVISIQYRNKRVTKTGWRSPGGITSADKVSYIRFEIVCIIYVCTCSMITINYKKMMYVSMYS